MAAVAHRATNDLFDAIHVVPRLHDVHLAHVLEIDALAARLGNDDDLDALAVCVVRRQRFQLGAIVGGQLLVPREHGVLCGEPPLLVLEALRHGCLFKQPPLLVVPREPHFFQGQRNRHRTAADVFAVNQHDAVGFFDVFANAGDFTAVFANFGGRKNASVVCHRVGFVFVVETRTVVGLLVFHDLPEPLISQQLLDIHVLKKCRVSDRHTSCIRCHCRCRCHCRYQGAARHEPVKFHAGIHHVERFNGLL